MLCVSGVVVLVGWLWLLLFDCWLVFGLCVYLIACWLCGCSLIVTVIYLRFGYMFVLVIVPGILLLVWLLLVWVLWFATKFSFYLWFSGYLWVVLGGGFGFVCGLLVFLMYFGVVNSVGLACSFVLYWLRLGGFLVACSVFKVVCFLLWVFASVC